MTRALRWRGACLAIALVMAWGTPCASGTAPHESRLAPFLARLRAAGRAELRIERRESDPLTGGERIVRGRVALEPPERARVDFEGGESVTLRGDGGEWLQPALQQMVRLGPERARGALGWCDLLLGTRAGITSRDLADGRVLLVRRDAAGAADSAWTTLDAAGQPSALEFRGASGELERLKLRRWAFAAPRGRAAFALAAPHGYEIVDLP